MLAFVELLQNPSAIGNPIKSPPKMIKFTNYSKWVNSGMLRISFLNSELKNLPLIACILALARSTGPSERHVLMVSQKHGDNSGHEKRDLLGTRIRRNVRNVKRAATPATLFLLTWDRSADLLRMFVCVIQCNVIYCLCVCVSVRVMRCKSWWPWEQICRNGDLGRALYNGECGWGPYVNPYQFDLVWATLPHTHTLT